MPFSYRSRRTGDGSPLIKMESIETACVSLEYSVDDMWAVDHMSPPVRLSEVEYTLGDLGVYAEVLGGDGDRQSPSRPDT